VPLRGLQEMYDLLRVRVDVRPVVIILLDGPLGGDQLPDVGGGRPREGLQEVGEVLELIVQVARGAQGLLVEVLDLRVFLLLLLALSLLVLILLL
jgi:hypothetical protein